MKVVISGAPGSGKTTLIEKLRAEFPDAVFVPEAAKLVIDTELSRRAEQPDYDTAVPWVDYALFSKKLMQKIKEQEASLPKTAKLVIMDRSAVDNLAFGRVHKCQPAIDEAKAYVRERQYDLVFICRPIKVFEKTYFRREDEAFAQELDAELLRVYHELGIPLVELPPVSLEERTKLVTQKLKEFSA